MSKHFGSDLSISQRVAISQVSVWPRPRVLLYWYLNRSLFPSIITHTSTPACSHPSSHSAFHSSTLNSRRLGTEKWAKSLIWFFWELQIPCVDGIGWAAAKNIDDQNIVFLCFIILNYCVFACIFILLLLFTWPHIHAFPDKPFPSKFLMCISKFPGLTLFVVVSSCLLLCYVISCSHCSVSFYWQLSH